MGRREGYYPYSSRFSRIPSLAEMSSTEGKRFEALAALSLFAMLILVVANATLVHRLLPLHGADGDFVRLHSWGRRYHPAANRADQRRGLDRTGGGRVGHINEAPTRRRQRLSESVGSGISACLLVNDENMRLPEWIAYHYTVLPLRHLIVAVDPASRSSPYPVLERWNDTSLGMTVEIWNDEDYMEEEQIGSPTAGDAYSEEDRLSRHRLRQWQFVMSCMRAHKVQNRTWVLLTDVDEYIVFNGIHDDDPIPPLSEAPPGIPTLGDWVHYSDGWVGGCLQELNSSDGSNRICSEEEEYFLKPKDESGALPGNVIIDEDGGRYYLRDEGAFRDKAALREPPPGVPLIKRFVEAPFGLVGYIYGSDTIEDGTFYTFDIDYEISAIHGGHIITDTNGTKYYLEYQQRLWPKTLSSETALKTREALPTVGGEVTVKDVLNNAVNTDVGVMGPCLTMPRLFYGSKESSESDDGEDDNVLDGYDKNDFVSLRYQYHTTKDALDLNQVSVRSHFSNGLLGQGWN